MELDQHINSILLDAASKLIAALKKQCDQQTMDAACNIIASWSAKFISTTISAALHSLKGINDENRKKIAMYLLTVFNTMFWESMRNFAGITDKELGALKVIAHKPPKIIVN